MARLILIVVWLTIAAIYTMPAQASNMVCNTFCDSYGNCTTICSSLD